MSESKKYNILRPASRLTENVGNNTFSYVHRSDVGVPTLYLPPLMQGALIDVEIGSEIVFEEYDNEVLSYNGLQKHILTYIKIGTQEIPVYIFDNHNWAFLYWWEYMKSTNDFGMDVIHIDQHSDMRSCDISYPGDIQEARYEDVLGYATRALNVGNFIIPALESRLISSVRQITGSIPEGECIYTWENGLQKSDIQPIPKKYILDIDIDYFASEMRYFSEKEKYSIIHHWIQNTSCITIATSPFFIEQDAAIHLIGEILSPYMVGE